jgi:hypothetical protein
MACVAYGIYTAYLRSTNSEKLGKLQAMRTQWGQGAGTAIHVVSYTVFPIFVGLLAITLAIVGKSFF